MKSLPVQCWHNCRNDWRNMAGSFRHTRNASEWNFCGMIKISEKLSNGTKRNNEETKGFRHKLD